MSHSHLSVGGSGLDQLAAQLGDWQQGLARARQQQRRGAALFN
ncbi:hypothetical protein [Microbulbifer sp. JSM ZJ756]